MPAYPTRLSVGRASLWSLQVMCGPGGNCSIYASGPSITAYYNTCTPKTKKCRGCYAACKCCTALVRRTRMAASGMRAGLGKHCRGALSTLACSSTEKRFPVLAMWQDVSTYSTVRHTSNPSLAADLMR